MRLIPGLAFSYQTSKPAAPSRRHDDLSCRGKPGESGDQGEYQGKMLKASSIQHETITTYKIALPQLALTISKHVMRQRQVTNRGQHSTACTAAWKAAVRNSLPIYKLNTHLNHFLSSHEVKSLSEPLVLLTGERWHSPVKTLASSWHLPTSSPDQRCF